MQDKELDQLFRAGLEHAEVQPSRDLWANISEGMAPKKAKREMPFYWIAAAVALVVLGVGLLRPGTEKIRLQAPAAVAANKSTVAPVVEQRSEAVKSQAILPEAEKSTALIIAPRLTAEEIKKNMMVLQPKAVDEHPVDRTERETVLAKEPTVKEEPMIASVDPVKTKTADEPKEIEPQERRGIRNVGDLVNYVVDRVDKRDNKVLKFSTDDDDNSSLIAINIGFIKLNPKRNK